MNKRILIISNARPSRTWNFANRILREVPGIEICGIVQRSIGSLPWVQQMIAAGKTRIAHPTPSWAAKAQSLIRFMADKVVDWLLWLVHGSPSPLNNPKRLTMERLRQECSKAGWPLAIAAQGEEARAVTSISVSPFFWESFHLFRNCQSIHQTVAFTVVLIREITTRTVPATTF